ncbi:MAG: hypothetical protein ACK56I_32440, partial [bacterium]
CRLERRPVEVFGGEGQDREIGPDKRVVTLRLIARHATGAAAALDRDGKDGAARGHRIRPRAGHLDGDPAEFRRGIAVQARLTCHDRALPGHAVLHDRSRESAKNRIVLGLLGNTVMDFETVCADVAEAFVVGTG